MARYYIKVEIESVDYSSDIESCNIRTARIRAGSFTIEMKNDNGIYKDTFSVGDDVVIYLDENNPPTTKIFNGLIEEIDYKTKFTRDFITLSGRDYTARLQDVTFLEVYDNKAPETIIKDIIDKYVTDITYNNVATTGKTIEHMTFKHKTAFEAIKELADICEYDFYVDKNRDLHFEPTNTVSSGKVFNNTNIIGTPRFRLDRNEMFNEVWFYGGRYLSGFLESFTADGVGSVFTLLYKPHNTHVTVDGVEKNGQIYNIIFSSPPSGINYLVDYNNKNVIFVSGTQAGDNIPDSGAAINIDYYRDLPIVKRFDDQSSIAKYGRRVKVFVENEITQPSQAEDLARAALTRLKNPAIEGNVNIRGINELIPGNTVIVDLPDQNISNQTFSVISVTYNINKNTLLSQEIIKCKLSTKIKDIVDVIKQMILDIKGLQNKDIDQSELLTRYEWGTGSFSVRQHYEVYTRDVSGCPIWDYNTYWDNANWDTPAPGAWVLNQSGGDF